MIMHNVDFLK